MNDTPRTDAKRKTACCAYDSDGLPQVEFIDNRLGDLVDAETSLKLEHELNAANEQAVRLSEYIAELEQRARLLVAAQAITAEDFLSLRRQVAEQPSRLERIATALMAGLVANPNDDTSWPQSALGSIAGAEALIAELDKDAK